MEMVLLAETVRRIPIPSIRESSGSNDCTRPPSTFFARSLVRWSIRELQILFHTALDKYTALSFHPMSLFSLHHFYFSTVFKVWVCNRGGYQALYLCYSLIFSWTYAHRLALLQSCSWNAMSAFASSSAETSNTTGVDIVESTGTSLKQSHLSEKRRRYHHVTYTFW